MKDASFQQYGFHLEKGKLPHPESTPKTDQSDVNEIGLSEAGDRRVFLLSRQKFYVIPLHRAKGRIALKLML